MLVQDPSKGNNVDAIFDQARQAVSVRGRFENIQPSSSSRSFSGTGRLLSGETVPTAPQQPESVVHNIVFWRNGFTVNDGPLRRLDDPENAPFLESIQKSWSALKSWNLQIGELLYMSTSDEGMTIALTLGSCSPTESVVAAPVHRTPSASIQQRLADGTRMVAHFNYHHTIADIHSFIDAFRPGGSRTYQLQTVGFPPKVLTDYSQTIEQAGLLNSLVVQKL